MSGFDGTVGDDEKRDLTDEDARELQLFQEKRRWFEGKLKVLEDQAPTYPFILPILSPSAADPTVFAYANESESEYRLPSADTLRTWQAERDALEEEVLAFDGGDLGRMKEKTREVTLVPLTKAATQAVAITLDLILLIDRLLTLLRRRSDLLELVGLRLQWDGLRWKVMLECAKLKEDVKTYVEGEGRWKAPNAAKGQGEEADPVTPVKRVMVDQANGASSATVSARKAAVSPITLFTPTRPYTAISPTTPISPTSLFTPQPQSRVQSLSIRHRTLTTTHLKRSSAILDRMIDIAGPLKGLGGLYGPLPSIEEGNDEVSGALPDELLDMQDDLETLCEDVKAQVEWCREVEEQRERSVIQYEAITRARRQNQQVISQLKESLAQPASSAQHETLAHLLREAESSLPAPLDKSFPRPRHADYPSVDASTADILDTLSTARSGAKEQLAISSDGVGWYSRLAAARSQLEEQDRLLGEAIPGLAAELDRLEKFRSGEQPPGRAEEEEWLSSAPGWITGLEQRIPDLTRQAQLLEMSDMRYKAAHQPPTSVRQLLGDVAYSDELHVEAGNRAEEALGLVRRAEEGIRRAKEDLEVLPLARRVRDGADDLATKFSDLRRRLGEAINSSAWRAGMSDHDARGRSAVELWRELLSCEDRMVQLRTTMAELDEARGKQERSAGVSIDKVAEDVRKAEEVMREVARIMDLLERMEKQRVVVWEVETEAEGLLRDIQNGAAASTNRPTGNVAVDRPAASDTGPAVDIAIGAEREQGGQVLQDRVRDWIGGLAERVPFVGTVHNSEEVSVDALVQSPAVGYSADLPSVDIAVRKHINELSTRVDTALSDMLAEQKRKADPADSPAAQPEPPTTDRTASSETSAASLTITPVAPIAEDVFGSLEPRIRTTSSTSSSTFRSLASAAPAAESQLSQIQDLRERVRSLRLADVVFPSSSAISRTPSLQRLPDAATVESVLAVLAAAESGLSATQRSKQKGEEQTAEAGEIKRETRKLGEELASARAFLPRLEALASFSARSKACDEAFGRLMEVIDSKESGGVAEGQDENITEGQAVLRQAEEAGMAVENDRRVISDLKRLRAIWTDLSSSLRHTSSSTPANGVDDDTASIPSVASSENMTISSIASPASPYISRIPIPTSTSKPRIMSSLSMRSNLSTNSTGMRSTSNPFPRLAMTTESSRNRTVSSSSHTPHEGRKRLDSSTSVRSGLSASGSNAAVRIPSGSSARSVSGAMTPPAGRMGERTEMGTASRIPRLAIRSPANPSSRTPGSLADGIRTRKASLPVRMGPAPGTGADAGKRRISEDKGYEADPKSTLDQAVGKIVNKLKMSVPIVPVNIAGTDEWKDQSGRYWIGAHGRAKLCFCRILRSRTVMVRVGGGWMELSRFLIDHFAEALGQSPVEDGGEKLPPLMTPMRKSSASSYGPPGTTTAYPTPTVKRVSVPANSAYNDEAVANAHIDLTPTSAAPLAPTSIISPLPSPMTPMRDSHIPRSISGSLPRSVPRNSVPLSRSSSYFSPLPLQSPTTPKQGDAPSGQVSGPASPLVPLHFLRKASESPPMREREKERLGVGRRSILGREGA